MVKLLPEALSPRARILLWYCIASGEIGLRDVWREASLDRMVGVWSLSAPRRALVCA